MTLDQFKEFVVFLHKKDYQIFNPQASQKQEGVFLIKKINPEKAALINQLPFYSWKKFFIPTKEKLFEFSPDCNNVSCRIPTDKLALLGINLVDLRAVVLYDQVFEKDFYYQRRRQNLLIIGHSLLPQISENIFEDKYEEDVLEHLKFDIFLAQIDKNNFRVFSGSPLGQKILNAFGCDYEHIDFSGPIQESGPDSRMTRIREQMKNNFQAEIWQELGQRCIECGRCSFVCPTCFCFDCQDSARLDQTTHRQRVWSSCYFDDFSEIAGNYRFLDTTAKKIHFWYYHKFARIPDQFSILGCVGCGRCSRVCPANINLAQTLKVITNDKN